jgi:hypothetical protein
MRKMYQVQMPGVSPSVQAVFNEIFRASAEADIVDIGAEYTIDGTYTETRTLDVDTPTAANVANVLATLLTDLKNGGAKKST